VNLGNLITGSNDAVSILILEIVAIFGLALGTLPDLNFHTASDDTDSHSGQHIVCCVGVVVHTAVEHCSSVFADTRLDHSTATRMVFDEAGDIVDNTSDGHKTTAVLRLVNVIVPFHDRELLERDTPIKSLALLIELLLKLLNTALLNFVGSELLEVVCKAELLCRPDEPFGWVVLPPFDSVAVIAGEFVVEVVVAFAKGYESGDNVIAGRVAVIEWLVAEPMGKGIDAESCLLDEEDAEDASVNESTPEITPEECRDNSWEDEAHAEGDEDVVLVLPDDNWVLVQIGDVGASNSLGVLLHDLQHQPVSICVLPKYMRQ
jgi:hypothetical protein